MPTDFALPSDFDDSALVEGDPSEEAEEGWWATTWGWVGDQHERAQDRVDALAGALADAVGWTGDRLEEAQDLVGDVAEGLGGLAGQGVEAASEVATDSASAVKWVPLAAIGAAAILGGLYLSGRRK